jgi:hypothetical protein
MSQLSQSQAVLKAVKQVLAEAGIQFEEGQDAKQYLTPEMKKQVINILMAGFKDQTIKLKDTPSNRAKLENEAELRKYCSGLQNNWLNKGKTLNGGVEYVAKNPGSRTGNSDPQIKALRALRAGLTDPSEIEEIDGYIAQRLKQIQPVKVKTQTIDFSVLPTELAQKYQSQS